MSESSRYINLIVLKISIQIIIIEKNDKKIINKSMGSIEKKNRLTDICYLNDDISLRLICSSLYI